MNLDVDSPTLYCNNSRWDIVALASSFKGDQKVTWICLRAVCAPQSLFLHEGIRKWIASIPGKAPKWRTGVQDQRRRTRAQDSFEAVAPKDICIPIPLHQHPVKSRCKIFLASNIIKKRVFSSQSWESFTSRGYQGIKWGLHPSAATSGTRTDVGVTGQNESVCTEECVFPSAEQTWG